MFPYEHIRSSQKELLEAVEKCLAEKKHFLAHAPTGLGKTAAVLSPALKIALEKNLTIFFLTDRHTQHRIVLDTAREIKNFNKVSFVCTSVIGKRHMCAQDGAPEVSFIDYCKHLRENKECHYYENFLKGSIKLELLKQDADSKHASEVIADAKNAQLCPYEVSIAASVNATLIVTDYLYLFHDSIRAAFLARCKKKLENSVIIVDEAHNLGSRLRDVYSSRLSTRMLRNAVKEAKKHDLDNVISVLVRIQDALNSVAKKEECLIGKSLGFDVNEAISKLAPCAALVKDEQSHSWVSGVVDFLEEWSLRDAGFTRIAGIDSFGSYLRLVCLDPGSIAKQVFDSCYSSIVMSGTLLPTAMFCDVLGLPKNTLTAEFSSPFPRGNQKVIIVPKTTTKYSQRSLAQYKLIAEYCSDLVSLIPGPCAIFFPSYDIRNNVLQHLSLDGLFIEKQGMTPDEKKEMLDCLSSSKNGVLLGLSSGSFGEGIDMPGVLKGVIVVGLPLSKPDLETNELIALYQQKFAHGWDYGYTLPAIIRVLQNAGRCIRSEKDKAVVVLLDERFAWPSYRACLPKEWDLLISSDYADEIREFFNKQ
ncbi:ATP-dependent DNA helicase [Candidatus Woesearchaeota archaeon]|nr:ATP-dependent DNA helicase [Candidatus Woesearchaeota archaeon]